MQLASRKPAEAPPPRMGTLAKLPVFLDLAGRRVVVAGATAPTAWKAELVAAAGAAVEIFAVAPGPEMEQLIARGSAAGRVVHVAQSWTPECLAGAAVALADAKDETEAQAFFEAARAAGALVNVIDKPAFCQFQLGSIVNRSPVVVAISTDGGSPILAQAIRRRIEMLLPPGLATWGRLASRVRRVVAERIPKGAPRRHFWEAFADRALREPPPRDDARAVEDLLTAAATQSPAVKAGRVTLVGAGPGDAELLTIKALRAMQSADVILYDDLVSADALELARREAKRMPVGKRGHRDSCAQGDINDLMISLARQGRHVVRLKSGDPMIFGRAGEEIAQLEAAGVAVDVVPGVTAALAAAARLGVSLTHRACAQSVRFVTGHAHDGALPDLDWRSLADRRSTLVFYMGGRTATAIAANLMAAGLGAATPVAVVAGLTRPDEQRWCGDLGALSAGPPVLQTDLPVLIGVGAVFAPRGTVRSSDHGRMLSPVACRLG